MRHASCFAVAVLFSLSSCKEELASANTAASSAGLIHTAGPASLDTDDLRITQEIVKTIADRNELSDKARKIDVATDKGHVTLRGTVMSGFERDVIETIASNVVGLSRVDNRLVVEPD